MFTVLDWIIVGVAVVAFVIGIIKGLFRQLFALGGILLVFKCGSLLTPYAQEWLSSLIPDDSVRSLVALLASYIVLFVVWALISGIILKILEKSKALGGINRIMGGVLGIAIVYVCCAVLFALVLKTSDTFMPWLKNIMKPLIEGEYPSWIVTNIFPADGNKLGEWIVRSLLDKLNEMMPDTGGGTGEAASAVLSWLVSAAAEVARSRLSVVLQSLRGFAFAARCGRGKACCRQCFAHGDAPDVKAEFCRTLFKKFNRT